MCKCLLWPMLVMQVIFHYTLEDISGNSHTSKAKLA